MSVRYDCCPYPYVNLNFLFRWKFTFLINILFSLFTVCVGSMWSTQTLAELITQRREAEEIPSQTSKFKKYLGTKYTHLWDENDSVYCGTEIIFCFRFMQSVHILLNLFKTMLTNEMHEILPWMILDRLPFLL